jgi:lycopene cyclase domain-containing protein
MSLYLIINLAAVSIPFLFSFHPRIRFDREWPWFFPAVMISAIIFIAWDIWFTQKGIWAFNEKYTGETKFSGIPFEEILFFICIPYASFFTLHTFRKLFPGFRLEVRMRNMIGTLLVICSLITALMFWEKLYTMTAFMATTITVAIGMIFLKEKMDHFYLMYAFILIPFFLVNGILTGMWIPEEVVWYNNEENLGIRLITIPVEDIFYGLSMLLSTAIILEKLKPVNSKAFSS